MTSTVAVFYLLSALPIVVVMFALVIGSRAERLGGIIYAVATALTWATQSLGDNAPYLSFMAIDFAATLAFLVLTLHVPEKLWPGVAGCGQFLVFVFSATRGLNFPLSEVAYLWALNLSGGLVLGALLLGTWASRWYKKPLDEWDLAAKRLGMA